MDKKKYRLRVPGIPYRPAFEFSAICHPQCVPQGVDRDGFFYGAIVVREEEEEEEYIRDTPCCFCKT